MLSVITKKSVMRLLCAFVAEDAKGFAGASMLTLERHLRTPWKRGHGQRLHRTVSTLVKKGFVYFDEPEDLAKPAKYIPTPEGADWIRGTP